VLVVDDEPWIAEAVARALTNAGFLTHEAWSGAAAERAIEEFHPDLVLLDAILPEADGFELARRLRDRHPGTPVIFVTARDAPEDKVAGLAVGDDYVTKPFDLAEVVARVRAVLRRSRGPDGRTLRFGDLILHEGSHEVSCAGTLVELTPTEFNLLRFFMLNPRQVLTKRQILDNVWPPDFDGEPGVVETYVSYLRKKLQPASAAIETVRFIGYALREPRA
jgi:two-component system OmpR family response regulator